MKDFQDLLKLVVEMDESLPSDPKKMVKPGTFAGTLEDSTNPTEAFQAFKAEHGTLTNSLKGEVEEITSYLTKLGMKTKNFAQSVQSSKFDTKNLPADPKKMMRPTGLDKGKLDAMKAYWNPTPPATGTAPATESAKHEAFDYDGNMATDESIRQARTYLNTAFGKFTESVNQLVARMTTKMGQFTGQMSDTAASLDEYKKKYAELETRYKEVNQQAGDSTVKLHELGNKIKELEAATGDAETNRTLVMQLRKTLEEAHEQSNAIREKSEAAMKEIKSQLQAAQSREAGMSAAKTAAAGSHQDFFDSYSKLENYLDQLQAEYEKVSEDVISLKKKIESMAGTATGFTSLGDKFDHHKPKGKFDLREHLERARLKQGRKANSGWF